MALLASPAAAHHRQTPPVVSFPTASDAFLPRVAAFRGRLVIALGAPGARQIIRRELDNTMVPLTSAGDNQNPTSTATGRMVAWDSDGQLTGESDPGRQIYVLTGDTLAQATHDPTGTSTNPAFDAHGRGLAFQSRGDLAGTGNSGASQIFVLGIDGHVRQATTGYGDSTDPVLDKFGKTLAFASTTDPTTGADTGVAQVFVSFFGGPPARITDGAGGSSRPALSPRGRFVAFESTADLVGTGADTGVTQIYVYDRKSTYLARVTNEPGGCTAPSVDETPGDFRVVFLCGGQGYVHFLEADRRVRLPIDAGTTSRAVGELGNYFVVVSTTADVLHGGLGSGFRLFQLNLFKLTTTQVPGTALWSPTSPFKR